MNNLKSSCVLQVCFLFSTDIEPLEQLIVDLEKEKILFDPNKTPKAYAAAL